ncbi:proton channel OTOP1 [Microcaecilia unicolor]|uniref:Proton channel OTOP1 n=1 Tax=Microcaecilia unicolor TaxID=1415580 RepID=A0A6P7XCX1_9AMPH|nr:proton channel OTOP1 [Microcaecilia unicolor]
MAEGNKLDILSQELCSTNLSVPSSAMSPIHIPTPDPIQAPGLGRTLGPAPGLILAPVPGPALTPEQEKKPLEEKINFSTINNRPKKNCEILSSQYGINVFLAGLLLMFAWAIHAVGLTEGDLLSYLITLMLIQLIWMLWYVFRSYSQRRLNKEKDTHAGARWLRCGITLFAVIALLLDSFKIGYFIGYSECVSVTESVFPVTHTVHTLLQVYFLWFHAKDIIQSFKTLERFGLIHAVFTNLLLWTNGILAESKHHLNGHKERLFTLGYANITIDQHAPECNCTTNVCFIFSQGIYYLYPFTIEYHILASTMLYVLWKNIGRTVHQQNQNKMQFRFRGVIVGTVLGLFVLTITIAIVVVYLIQIECSKSKSEAALTMFYLYGITVLTLMCTAGIVSLLISRYDDRSLDDSESPCRKLDANLLVGSACGSWFISWGSILAVIFADTHPQNTWYNLPYSILVIIEKYVQNLFIVECVHCKDGNMNDDIRTIERIITVTESTLSLAPSYETVCSETNLIFNKPLPQGSNTNVSPTESYGGLRKRSQGNNSCIRLPVLHFLTPNTMNSNLSMRRWIRKNAAAFLFLCNVSLWIPLAFGCRPQFDNGLEELVFGFEPWIIVVNLAMPFSIFYRMHSASCLFEIYSKS